MLRGTARSRASAWKPRAAPREGPLIAVLEGGYDLDGLATSGAALTRVLLGEAPAAPAGSPHPVVERLLAAFRETLAPFWPAIA